MTRVSILGLNERLQKGTPNMSQRTVPAMVKNMKNGTMAWLTPRNTNCNCGLVKKFSEDEK